MRTSACVRRRCGRRERRVQRRAGNGAGAAAATNRGRSEGAGTDDGGKDAAAIGGTGGAEICNGKDEGMAESTISDGANVAEGAT